MGGFLLEYRDRLPQEVENSAQTLAQISKQLRKERDTFYGDIDFIPSLEDSSEDGECSERIPHLVVAIAEKVIEKPSPGEIFI